MVEIHVEAKDNAIWQIVPRDITLEQIATGFGFTEGPIWCGDFLLFSDIPRNRIVRWRPLEEGPEVTTFRSPSDFANGLTLDRSGRLLACEYGERRITRTGARGTIEVLAVRHEGRRLSSPNDIVVRSDGSIYFTDPPYGLERFKYQKEVPVNGVYRITPDGEVSLATGDLDRPNGLAFSPDESILYIADTTGFNIRAFDVNPDGSLGRGRVFIDMKAPEVGSPDGMKVDRQGNIYCTGPGGIWVIQPDGKCLGRLVLPELPANLAWGGPDWKTVYITARTSIYRLRLNIPGIAVPRLNLDQDNRPD